MQAGAGDMEGYKRGYRGTQEEALDNARGVQRDGGGIHGVQVMQVGMQVIPSAFLLYKNQYVKLFHSLIFTVYSATEGWGPLFSVQNTASMQVNIRPRSRLKSESLLLFASYL